MGNKLGVNLSRGMIKTGFWIGIFGIIVILLFGYVRYKVSLLEDEEMSFAENLALFYLFRGFCLLAAVARLAMWLFILRVYQIHHPQLTVKLLYVIIGFEILSYLTQDSMIVNMMNSEILATLGDYFKGVVVDFLLFIIYFFAGIKIRKLKIFSTFGWVVQFVLAPSLLLFIYSNWDLTNLTIRIYDMMAIIPFAAFLYIFIQLKKKETIWVTD